MKKHLHIGLSVSTALVVTLALFIASFAYPQSSSPEGTSVVSGDLLASVSDVSQRSGKWKRCDGKRVPIDEPCNVEVDESSTEVIEEVKNCFSFNYDKPLPVDIMNAYYYHDDAVALYSTYLNDTDPVEYLLAGYASLADDGDVKLMPNHFTTRMEALELALQSNCYMLEDDVWAQAVEMGLVEEDADPDEFITVSEGRTIFTTAANVDLKDYFLEDYIPGNKLLNRDAWGMAADLISMSDNVDEKSKLAWDELMSELAN